MMAIEGLFPLLNFYTLLILDQWGIQDYTDDEPIAECYYCGSLLNPMYDHYCRLCNRPACDNCSQACHSDEDYDVITCQNCVEGHWRDHQTGNR